ncbi:DNA-3-methyladenine glycosylase family protein [Chitinophaga varians]|uniref:DNA-3-methyladenine glycosylase family protein n=1 Tax=Chitinophaga varians TaxID=2202339 RepID=UPI00165F1F7A|nr:DNA-3-methyladenine glycosylase 2 family protein [Chitinophaga varians]MBC9910824.1 DNA-3-methyladenine glycosylase 2 family protein [Chitinophaga varians]
MPRPSGTPVTEHAYISHLSKDKKLQKIIKGPLEVRTKRKNFPLRLIGAIMSQQLSTKVADVIYARFLALYDNKEPTPQQVAATDPSRLRAIGLSNAKVSYVQNVANFVIAQKLTDARLHKMDDEAVILCLTQIKGVGRWTVEMLLMFHLHREDVFSVDDLGIQQAMARLYKLDIGDKKAFREQLKTISAKWSPYRTHACRYLWQWKDQ